MPVPGANWGDSLPAAAPRYASELVQLRITTPLSVEAAVLWPRTSRGPEDEFLFQRLRCASYGQAITPSTVLVAPAPTCTWHELIPVLMVVFLNFIV